MTDEEIREEMEWQECLELIYMEDIVDQCMKVPREWRGKPDCSDCAAYKICPQFNYVYD